MTHPEASAEEPSADAVVLPPTAEPSAPAQAAPAAVSDSVALIAENPAAAPSRSKLVPMLIAAGVTVALALGVGVYAGYRLMRSGDGPQPAERMPASVIAYAGIDLSPGLAQQIKLLKLAGKMPDRGQDSDPKQLLNEALRKLKVDGVDGSRDLASWLGLRVGAGLWLDSRNRPYALIAAASTDQAAATKGLTTIRKQVRDADMGFVVQGDLALIAVGERDAQAAADTAATQAAQSSLAATAKFRDARKWLADGQLAVFWADLDRYGEAMKAIAGPELGEIMAGDLAEQYHGTVVLGVQATDDGIEARFRTFGAKSEQTGLNDALSRLGKMPDSAEVALVTRLPEHNELGSPLSPYSAMSGAFSSWLLLGSGGSPLGDPSLEPPVGLGPGDLNEADSRELDALMSKDPATLTAAERKRVRELMGGLGAGPDGGPGAEFAAISDLFEALSGATVSVIVTSFNDMRPAGRLVAEVLSADNAARLLEVGEVTDGRFTATAQGNTVTVLSKGFAPGPATLADDATFRKATAGGPANSQTAIYVKLAAVVPPSQRDKLPFQAFAVIQGVDNGDQIGLIRVIVG